MPPKEKYLPVEVDLGSVKARVRIKVSDNETAADMAKRVRGIEVEETRMGAYIKRVNLQEFLFKNKDVVVDYVDGDIKNIDGKNEQWIQVYVDGGLPVMAVNGEAVGLGISNFYVGNIGALTIKDEEKIGKYTRNFSYSDAEAIINGALSNKIHVSCPGGAASAEFSRKVFDVFLILKEDGVVGFYDGSPETKPLGWREWVFPEKGVDKKHLFERMGAYNIKVEYLAGAHMVGNKKKIGFEFEGRGGSEYGYYEKKTHGCYENAERPVCFEEQKIESKKIENQSHYSADVFDAKPEPEVKFEQEKGLPKKAKPAATACTPKAMEYTLFEEEFAEKRGEGIKTIDGVKKERKNRRGFTFTIHEQREGGNKQQVLKGCGKIPYQKTKAPEEFFSKKMKISLQELAARKENIKKRLEAGIAILKEKIQKMKTGRSFDGMSNKIKIATCRISERMEKVKADLEKVLAKRKNKKDGAKNKKIIFILLLEKWFPKIKRVGRCSL